MRRIPNNRNELLNQNWRGFSEDEKFEYLKELITSVSNRRESVRMRLLSISALYYRQRSIQIISEILRGSISGETLLTKKLKMKNLKNETFWMKGILRGGSLLHFACACNAPMEIISLLLQKGGRDLVMMKSDNSITVLHYGCLNNGCSMELISKLIEVGGKGILSEEDNLGRTALHICISKVFTSGASDSKLRLILKEGIITQVGGEFAIGGIFNSVSGSMQREIYNYWAILAPILRSVIDPLQKQPPILHAAIMTKAPRHIIMDIINRFNCICKQDSLGRLPIDVAVVKELRWNNEGMMEIVMSMATHQQRHPIYIVAEHGLKWRDHNVREIVESNVNEIFSGSDGLTGLRPFMVAAMGESHCDLSVVYNLMKMAPEL